MVKVGSSWFGHFDDAFQYEDFAKPWSARCIAVTENFERETGLKAYEAWMRSRTGIPTECGRQVRAPLLSHCFGPRSQGRRPCGELRGWGPQLAISARPARLADRHSRIAFQSDVRSPNLCRHFNAGAWTLRPPAECCWRILPNYSFRESGSWAAIQSAKASMAAVGFRDLSLVSQ